MLSLPLHHGDNFLKSSKTRYRLERGRGMLSEGKTGNHTHTAVITPWNDGCTAYKYRRTEIRPAYFV